MDEKTLLLQLDALKAALEKNLDEKAQTAIKAAIAGIEAQIKQLDEKTKEIAALNAKLEKLEADAAKNQKALDDFLAKQKEIATIPAAAKTFSQNLIEQLEGKKEALKKYKEGGAKGFAVELPNVKAVGDFTSAGNLTGTYFVPPQVVPGITTQPYEETHMRDILPVGSTTSNIIRFIRDNGGEGAPGMTAESGTKPQMDRDLQIYDAPVRKIATYMRLPEEMIEDIPYLQSFLTNIGMEEVMIVEDAQILYGDGTGQNLTGLFNTANSTLFNPGDSVVQDANEFDVIRAARKQLRVAKLGGPLVAVVSPEDYFNMTSQKDTTNNYLFLGGGNGIALANPNAQNGALNIGGVTIQEHTAVVAGDFLVFQPRAASIYDRAGTTIRFYDQDQDNAIKNLITIVIEKRLALAVYRPAGIIRGKFVQAINDLANDSE